MLEAGDSLSLIFIELGLAVIGLALLARLASRWGFSPIPLYLLAGLGFGNGGILPLPFSEDFIHVGAEIGVLLLLFMLGLEYTGAELGSHLRKGLPAGILDLTLNFPPGLLCGVLLGLNPLESILLGGVTYISSSGVIARVLAELGRMKRPETPVVLSVLVIEDLVMAVFLPLVAVLLIGREWQAALPSIALALAAVGVVLFAAMRFGGTISRALSHESNEIILLTVFGTILLVAGISQRLQVSAAIGAFLVGIAISGPMAGRAHDLLSPLRDLFAATFFFFFGLQIDPGTLPPVLPIAAGLALVTGTTKFLTGWWSAARRGIHRDGRLRAGAALVARGEFSIVIADLGIAAGLDPRLGPLSAAYVLFMVILGPLLIRAAPEGAESTTREEEPT